MAVVHHAAGRGGEAEAALRELEENWSIEAAYQIAAVHAFIGDPDGAFRWLERSYEQRDSGLVSVLREPTFRTLHEDPRWEPLIRKIGFRD